MKCQICEATDATVHIKEVKNDQVTELHLCENCAREKGFHSMIDQGKLSLASQFIWMAEHLYPDAAASAGHVQCTRCGLRYSEFMQLGRLGCPNCYRDFSRQLKQILRRAHGSVRHVGKGPGRAGESSERRALLQKLREDLERAVEREEYERAAAIRDQIRDLEAAAGSEAAPSQAEGGAGPEGSP
jgi:protein arginine kinase activator